MQTLRNPAGVKAKVAAAGAAYKAGARALGARAIAVGTAPLAAGASALGVAGTSLAVGAAFGIGYAIGTGLRALWQHYSADERAFRRARAFRKAREDFAARAGRPPNSAEVKEIARAFDLGVKPAGPPSGTF